MIDGEEHWFFPMVDPTTSEIVHIGVSTSRPAAAIKLDLREYQEKCHIEGPRLSSMVFSS